MVGFGAFLPAGGNGAFYAGVFRLDEVDQIGVQIVRARGFRVKSELLIEFADYYREKKTYTEPECALWRDILYGSNKQLFWYCDPYMRAGVNMDQGGAIFDLRPYVAKLHWPVGIGTPHVQDASYPFLMQEKYRAGYFTHYAGEGTIRSAKICHNGEEVDLCLCRTKAHFSQEAEAAS